MNASEQKQKTRKHPILRRIPLFAFLCIALLLFFTDRWYIRVYDRVNFDSILYTLTANLAGSSSTLFLKYVWGGLLPTIAACVALILPACLLIRKGKIKKSWHLTLPIVLLSVGLIVFAAFDSQLVEYIVYTNQPSTLYEDEYRDPSKVTITFPEEKRNIIYIMLESYELSFTSEEQGGALEHDAISELYKLAQENINFSQNDGVGGFRPSTGATWTIGAMVSQTSGIPLAPIAGADAQESEEGEYGEEGTFLPGATTLTDILHEAGYYQALMVGSDADFGNRKLYFESHNMDKVYDLYTAQQDGIVEPDYNDGWWGMEDYYLYEYAKQELTKISQLDQPFAFTMLTVDTHHVSGHWSELCCDNEFERQYDNVFSCASRQAAAFLAWIMEQPFYENTTVIIVGDHCSMDADYFRDNVDDDYVRRVYNCFINTADTVNADNTKNREFTTIDLFPTTLAAIGCTIEGDRLGLGTNLFSGEQTLSERWGYDELCEKLFGGRSYYADHFTSTD